MKRVIGLTGGIGSGKSRITDILKNSWEAEIIQADQVAAMLQRPGQKGLQQLVEKFGTRILDDSGYLDRKVFADMIFQDEKILKKVNDIIHPITYREIEEQIAASSSELIVVESALFNQETAGICQEIWFVDTSDENRIERLMLNRGYSREKCISIMQHQPSRKEFLAISDHVIDNNGSLRDVEEQIKALLEGVSR